MNDSIGLASLYTCARARTVGAVEGEDEVHHVLERRVHARAQVGGEGVNGVALRVVLHACMYVRVRQSVIVGV